MKSVRERPAAARQRENQVRGEDGLRRGDRVAGERLQEVRRDLHHEGAAGLECLRQARPRGDRRRPAVGAVRERRSEPGAGLRLEVPPLLRPGEMFEYNSGTSLSTPSGFMSGTAKTPAAPERSPVRRREPV